MQGLVGRVHPKPPITEHGNASRGSAPILPLGAPDVKSLTISLRRPQ